MSMFNIAVPMHPATDLFLEAIRWHRKDRDPDNKYPLLGRLRYAWLSEKNNVKLLLKNGPDSWSNSDPIVSQILQHEGYVSSKVLERDSCYIVAEIKPVTWTAVNDGDSVDTIGEKIIDFLIELNQDTEKYGMTSIYKDPFDIFEEWISENSTDKK